MTRTKWWSGISFLLIGILAPTILAYLLFWYPPFVRVPIQSESTPENYVRIVPKQQSIGFIETVRLAFQAPFDLSRYWVCLRNKTTVEGAVGEKAVGVTTELLDQNGKSLGFVSIPGDEGLCLQMQVPPPLTIKTTTIEPVEVDSKYLPAILTLKNDVAAIDEMGIMPTWQARFVSTVIFLLAYGVLVELAVGLWQWGRRAGVLVRRS